MLHEEGNVLDTNYDNILNVLDGEEVLRYDDEVKGNILAAAYRSTTFIENINLSSDDINNIVSSYSRTLHFLIVKSLIQNNVCLSEENIDLIIDCIFNELNKENIIFFAVKMHDANLIEEENLRTKKQVEKIIDLAVKTNDSELIYNVSKILKDRLDKENVSKVSRKMSKQENIYYVYDDSGCKLICYDNCILFGSSSSYGRVCERIPWVQFCGLVSRKCNEFLCI